MKDADIIKWLMLFGRGWVIRGEVYRVMDWGIGERQTLHSFGWLDHTAEAEFNHESHYRLSQKALDRLSNKVHEGELSYD